MDLSIYQSGRLYLWDEKVKKYRWVVDPKTAIKVWGKDWESKTRTYLEVIYPINVGEPISDWPEPEEPEPNQNYEVRPLFILGSCLPTAPVGDAVKWGINSFIGNHGDWPHSWNIKDARAKSIVCINVYNEGTSNARPFKDSDVPYIEQQVRHWLEYFGPDGVAGWWSAGSRGEEPDAVAWGSEDYAQLINESRKLFYKTVRAVDPDYQKHPVVEQFDLTHVGMVGGAWRAGWERMWLDKKACDLVLFDLYVRNCTKQEAWDAVHKYWDIFPGHFCSKDIQVIPQLACYDYRPGIFHDVVEAYKDVIGPKLGLAFYSDEIIRPQPEVQAEIKEVIAECMSSF